MADGTRSSGIDEGFGGAHLALIGFASWVLFAATSAVLGDLPRALLLGVPAGFGGVALMMSGLDVVKGMWVRGAKGLGAGGALLLLIGYLWLTTGGIP